MTRALNRPISNIENIFHSGIIIRILFSICESVNILEALCYSRANICLYFLRYSNPW